MLDVFASINKDIYKEVEIPTIEIPLPVKTSLNTAGTCQDDCIFKILKYIYNSQNFDVIKNEINDKNASQLYSQAYVLKCTNLLKSLESLIVNQLLKLENATYFFLDAILVSFHYYIYKFHII